MSEPINKEEIAREAATKIRNWLRQGCGFYVKDWDEPPKIILESLSRVTENAEKEKWVRAGNVSTQTCPNCGSTDIRGENSADQPETEFQMGCENCSATWDSRSVSTQKALPVEAEAMDLLREAHSRMGNTAFPSLAARIAKFLEQSEPDVSAGG